jgi:hypothetical protein
VIRRGEKLGRPLEDFSVQASVDQFRVVEVVVKGDAGNKDENNEKNGQENLKDRLSEPGSMQARLLGPLSVNGFGL